MTKLLSLTHITKDQYLSASRLWEITGVGNPARGDSLKAVRQTLQHGGRLVLLYEEDTMAGTVWLTHDFRRLYVHHMAVHPDYQNRGCGKALLQEALRYARVLGLQAKLEVNADNAAALTLYGNSGFVMLDGYKVMIKRDI